MHHAGHGSWMLAVCLQSFCDELVSLGQQRAQRPDPGVREGLHASHDRWQLGRTAGHASVGRRRAAALTRTIAIAPRVMWSSFESESGHRSANVGVSDRCI